MILGAEIGMLVIGIMALIQGKLVLSKTRVVRGTPARLLGAVALLPLPLSLMAGILIGILWVAQGKSPTDATFKGIATGIEAACVLFCLALVYGIGWGIGRDPNDPNP